MVKYKWKFFNSTDFANIFLDLSKKMTKIETNKFTYYHKGLYPYHNPEYFRKFKKVIF